MQLFGMGLGHLAFDTMCLAAGVLAITEVLRGLWLFNRWMNGKLDPAPYRDTIWLWRTKILLAGAIFLLLWFVPSRLAVFGAVAGLLLVLSVVISRSAPLQRYKPIRMLRGMRLVACVAAGVQCAFDLLG